MSVSRDFIDSCSPEAPARIEQDAVAPPLGRTNPSQRAVWRYNVSFRFPRHPKDFAQRVDILVQDWFPLPFPWEPAPPDWAPPRSPLRRRAGRRGLLRIPHQFLTSCLPASLIIRSPLWDVRGPVVRPGRRGRNL